MGKTVLCECGCGLATKVAPCDYARLGWVKGRPIRFINGHNASVREIDPNNLPAHGKRTRSGCLEWTRARTKRGGYGAIGVNGKKLLVHRLTLEKKIGRKLMSNEYACHSCDNPPCFEESHLFVGTHQENVRDATAKGKLARVLDETMVREIRARIASGESQASIAKSLRVAPCTIGFIKSGRTWKWVI